MCCHVYATLAAWAQVHAVFKGSTDATMCVPLAAFATCTRSASVTLQPAATEGSCPSLAYLQPSLAFRTGEPALPGLSVPGLLLGSAKSNTSDAGVTQMQQGAIMFLSSAPRTSEHQLLAQVGATSVASGAIQLPGAMAMTVEV